MECCTGLFGNDDLRILESVIGQLSDGIWENSHMCEKYWKNCNIYECLVSEEIIIDYPSWLFESPRECKKYFANKIKQIVKKEQEWSNPNINWKRDCEIELEYFRKGITVADAYKAYDTLLER